MATRTARLGDTDPNVPFLYRKGDRVIWKRESGEPDREFRGEVVDGWCEFESGGGSYRTTYLVERKDGMRFPAEETRLVKAGDYPKSIYVRSYIAASFHGWKIDEREIFERDSYSFRVEDVDAHQVHRVLVSSEFLDDHDADEIRSLLEGWDLAGTMRRVGREIILVANSGLLIGLPSTELPQR